MNDHGGLLSWMAAVRMNVPAQKQSGHVFLEIFNATDNQNVEGFEVTWREAENTCGNEKNESLLSEDGRLLNIFEGEIESVRTMMVDVSGREVQYDLADFHIDLEKMTVKITERWERYAFR